MKFVIKTPLGLVAGFACGCVQIAGTADFAKLFATKAAAILNETLETIQSAFR